jgi:hypothetical protein
MRLQTRARNGLTENSLSNGTLLWRGDALLDGLLSFVCHGFGVFSSRNRGRRCEVMEVYASGFAGHPGSYFIDCESALGVMTGWRVLLEYQVAGFSSRMRRVFIEQCFLVPELKIFCGFWPRGRSFLLVRLGESS